MHAHSGLTLAVSHTQPLNMLIPFSLLRKKNKEIVIYWRVHLCGVVSAIIHPRMGYPVLVVVGDGGERVWHKRDRLHSNSAQDT